MTDTDTPVAPPKGGRRTSKAAPSGTRLVIVESPAKAKTIAGYLGAGYVVESSIGHIRDLPKNAADVPASHKGQAWARLGVDVDHGFETLYVVSQDKKQQVAKLKALLKDASELYLATDEDREGEAIAWHLLETLKPKIPVRRMVFHEITQAAIQAAVDNPRELDTHLVDAQETRRVLDRLYGYEVSPVLWKKVMPKLSAGRVQSVATRIVVERERARMAFREGSYWDVEGLFTKDDESLTATLVQVDGTRLATGKDFDAATGGLKAGAEVTLLDEASVTSLVQRLDSAAFTVRSVESRPYTRRPSPPFMTSTLQQEAGRKLRFSAQRTMQTAQRLYENGHITYMRTDSTNLSATALSAARQQARDLYGPEYVPEAPRSYAKKVKNAQEAHEAIRPSGDSFATPGQLARQVSADELRLYELIWQRTVASQMNDARGTSSTVRLGAQTQDGTDAEFSASGTIITFQGFMRAYVEGSDDEVETPTDRRLPQVTEGDALSVSSLTAQGHTTSPPARYTEASLVKRLEELGIGRPSTYASIISTVQDRGYVWKKGSALVPTWLAFAVMNLLEQHFARLVDYGFTASLEDDLDVIAGGDGDSTGWLTRFYFGSEHGHEGGVNRQGGLKKMVSERLEDIDARDINSIVLGRVPEGQDQAGTEVIVRVGRYGPYVTVGREDGAARASLPEEIPPDELTVERAIELANAPSGDRVLGQDPTTGYDVVSKAGRYGPYVSLVLPEGSTDKPPTGSLFASMDLETITLEQALTLLTLPRTLGESEGEPVTAQNGRYGPYVSRGKESRSVETEEALLTISLPEALHLLAQPKQYGRRAAPKPPLKTLGKDPTSGAEMVVKEGRFGPYVTDGETNASLRKGDTPEGLEDERASELLAERRARGPATKKAPVKKAPAKKTPAKKAPAKRTATKKSPAKKATGTKTAAARTASGRPAQRAAERTPKKT